jgi:hypothetical protein
MKHNPWIEALATKYLVVTITLVIVLVPISFALVIRLGIANIDTLANFVDAVFKTIAILVGAVWALNRLYVARTDATQIRVDDDISYFPASRFSASQRALFIYRLDIVNTGKTLIEPFQQYVEVQAVVPSNESIEYMTIWRWPSEGMHPGGPIEPGSWSAINDTVAVSSNVQAIRLYLGVQLSENHFWSWHKTFDISTISP